MSQTGQNVGIKEQPFAKPEKLHDIIAENYKDIRKKLLATSHAMSLYLANKDIEQIILKRVKVITFNYIVSQEHIIILTFKQYNITRIICSSFMRTCFR